MTKLLGILTTMVLVGCAVEAQEDDVGTRDTTIALVSDEGDTIDSTYDELGTAELTAAGFWACGLEFRCTYPGECYQCCEGADCALCAFAGTSLGTAYCTATRRIQYANRTQ